MKTLIVRNATSYDFGGAERLAVHIAAELAHNNIEATVVSRQKRLLDYARSAGTPYIKGWWWSRQNWSGVRALGFPVYLVWQLLLLGWYVQLIIRKQPDIVHLMSKDDFIAGTLAGKLLGKGVIWTDTADLKYIFANHNVWYKNPVGKLVYAVSPLASAITAVSQSERNLIAQSVGHALGSNFTIMYSTGKDETAVPITRSPADEQAVVFCATSRLVIAKGIGDLITAFTQLTKNANNYRLWLVGNGPDEAQFKAAANGNPYITFVGHSDTPLAYVAAADVFVHPTHHEGFSLALAEAAMLGKPMIATNVGGNPELVNDQNGILTPVQDPAAFCAAMQQLGTDASMRARFSAQARKDYVQKFDFSTITQQTLIPLYEKAR